ncbi:hypothetical protein MPSEU_000166800 [Mayamaea pseudoterrestris]|nr:hypothetical protein MPSEU_000166800 [Mayamaea pseudoterrestris]
MTHVEARGVRGGSSPWRERESARDLCNIFAPICAMMTYSGRSFGACLFLSTIVNASSILSLLTFVNANSFGTETLPRSTHHAIPRSNTRRRQPPWNPSSQIDADGFLSDSYLRLPGDWEEEFRLRTSFSTDHPCFVRQVPGDGNCLFHSISLCLYHAENGTHWNIQGQRSLDELYQRSRLLRSQAVECLKSSNRRLFLQGRESLKAHELVQAAAQQYGLTSDEYCEAMQQDCVWGGGPEIVALCNQLQRPIHVYELATSLDHEEEDDDMEDDVGDMLQDSDGSFTKRRHRQLPSTTPSSFILRRMACFGSPRFDKRPALHILSADSRFPDLQPGSQLASGNHFLAVFPVMESRKKPRKLLRGGSIFLNWRKDDEDAHEHELMMEANDSLIPNWVSLTFWKRFLFGWL